jgi:hypothetical protein
MFPVAAPTQPNREAPQTNQPSINTAIRTDHHDDQENGQNHRFTLPNANPIPYEHERDSVQTDITDLSEVDDDEDDDDLYGDLRVLNDTENLFYQTKFPPTVDPNEVEQNRTRFKCKDGATFYIYHNLPHYLAVNCPEHHLASFPNQYPWNGEQGNQAERSHIDLLPGHYNPEWFDKRSPHLWSDYLGWVVDYNNDPEIFNHQLIVCHYDGNNNLIEQLPEFNHIHYENEQEFHPNKRKRS